MTLQELIAEAQKRLVKNVSFSPQKAAREIRQITDDSRQVTEESLFVASPQGLPYTRQVLQTSRALILIAEEEYKKNFLHCPEAPRFVPCQDLLRTQGELAASLYARPSEKLELVGITGTNGKTSIAWMLHHIWNSFQIPWGMIGTLGAFWKPADAFLAQGASPKKTLQKGKEQNEALLSAARSSASPRLFEADPSVRFQKTGYTTPRAPQLQALLSEMLSDGVQRVALEVSSEALSLGRLFGCQFRRAVFTNLSQDHLDHHKTMEDYYRAKRLLFEMCLKDGGEAILYAEGTWGKRLFWELGNVRNAGKAKKSLCKKNNIDSTLPTPRNGKSVKKRETKAGKIRAIHKEDIKKIPLPAPAFFNYVNANLALLASGFSLGKQKKAEESLKNMPQIPGRFELVFPAGSLPQDGADWPKTTGLVDYAHTPDALENLLNAARSLPVEKLICVFGCGGDRDPGKRSLMGEIAARLSDFIIVCDDNPRSEEPAKIRKEILAGARRALSNTTLSPKNMPLEQEESALESKEALPKGKKIQETGDRKKAIEKAVQLASTIPGKSLVIVAGKGHEEVQIFKDKRIPFSDRAELQNALSVIEKEGFWHSLGKQGTVLPKR